jgi:hypothetical protein
MGVMKRTTGGGRRDLVCDLCGHGPFTRPNHLLKHRGSNWCEYMQRKSGKGTVPRKTMKTVKALRRLWNVQRTLEKSAKPFILFVKDTAARQESVRKARVGGKRVGARVGGSQKKRFLGAVNFVPFGDVGIMALDCDKVSAVVRASMVKAGGTRRVGTDRTVATAAAAAMLWTTSFARTIGIVPVPFTKRYAKTLAARLQRTRNKGVQVVNVAILGCCCRSFLKVPRSQVASKVNDIVESVRRLSDAARVGGWTKADVAKTGGLQVVQSALGGRGLRADSYNMKFIRPILERCGYTVGPDPDVLGDDHYHLAGNALEGLAELSGDALDVLQSNDNLAKQRMRLLCSVVRDKWSRVGGARVRMPPHHQGDVQAQLCAWIHGGKKEKSFDYDRVMRAAVTD